MPQAKVPDPKVVWKWGQRGQRGQEEGQRKRRTGTQDFEPDRQCSITTAILLTEFPVLNSTRSTRVVQRLGDVNFDYSQIQWQGLWPQPDLLVVLRSKTAARARRPTAGLATKTAPRYIFFSLLLRHAEEEREKENCLVLYRLRLIHLPNSDRILSLRE
ncbi:hypothetical protein M0804_012431 [Polistes exclamans]|nr:hypothetical protein M0804_012431 [Polistes exclamans]